MPQNAVRRPSDRPYFAGKCLRPVFCRPYSAGGRAAKVWEYTIDTAADDTDYALEVEGSDGDMHDITINSGAGATKTSIRNQLINAINQEADVAGRVVAASSASDKFTVTGRDKGDDFLATESDANLSLSNTVAADDGDSIRFGVGVMHDDAEPLAVENPTRTSTAAVAKVLDITPDPVNDARYLLAISLDEDGDGIPEADYNFEFLADASATADEIVDGLVADINAAMAASTILAANSASKLRLTSEVAGVEFDANLTSDNATVAAQVKAVVTANVNAAVALDNNFAGVACRSQFVEADANGISQYGPGDTLEVLKEGEVVVLLDAGVDPTPGSNAVHLRCVASGSEVIGAFRDSADGTDTVPVSNCYWTSGATTSPDGENVARLYLGAGARA